MTALARPPIPSVPPASRWPVPFAAVLIGLAALAAYHNTFSVPFFFDDLTAITGNASIRRLSALGDVLSPPGDGSSATGRPLVNLSFAINYALGGLEVRGYHVFNLLLHAAAGLALFGLVRRTLLLPSLAPRYGPAATPLALLVALLWTVHPLQTESVTCVVQRTEVLVGCWFLLTFYCFVRGLGEKSSRAWHPLAVLACLLGMASKEVMVSAPLLVLLYDRTFFAGTFRAAWRQRWKIHLSLAATWLLLAWLVAGAGGSRGTAAGFGLGVTWWSYALKQCEAIVLYLRLSLWPHPLVLDYGTGVITHPGEVWPQAAVLTALVAGALAALWRKPLPGFLGFAFFAILAPSSSVVPLVSQTMAEHRMYLPLAAVVTLAVVGGYALAGRRLLWALAAVAVVFCGLTVRRNATYASAISIWTDTLARCPESNRARVNLANALKEAGRLPEAIVLFQAALKAEPDHAAVLGNLGSALALSGRNAEAIAPLERAIALNPRLAEAHANLGAVLTTLGRPREGAASLQTALALNPLVDSVRENLAGALLRLGAYADALAQCDLALREHPRSADAHFLRGDALLRLGRPAEAVTSYQTALQLRPDFAAAHGNLATAYFHLRRPAEAADHYREALRLAPGQADAHNNLASALLQLNQPSEAVAHYRAALELRPDYVDAQANLGIALAQLGRLPEAIAAYEAALRLDPNHPVARQNLAYLRSGQALPAGKKTP